jgi:pyruvate,water dikinase
MNESFLLPDWLSVLAAGPAKAGGKGWQLARLARYGLPVPDGFVIPASLSRAWLAASGLEARLDQASRQALAGQAGLLDALQSEFLHIPLPQPILEALHVLCATRGWSTQPLAVRSSAVGEDSLQASFAGIYKSCLNVTGPAALEHAVRSVWVSLWSATAVAYRHKMGLALDQAAMAVVVMPLLPAVASGLAFTCDPFTGREDRTIIHAAWGLGETLAHGQAEGDEYKFLEDPRDDGLRLESCTLGRKQCQTVPDPDGGTHVLLTPENQRRSSVLGPAEARSLAELVQDAAVALDFARPFFDLEWVWDGGRFWLTQARPMTGRPGYTYPVLRDQPAIWSRANFCETMPDPLSPIDWSHLRRLLNLQLETVYALEGYAPLPGLQRAGLFQGRLYLNLSLIQWEGFDTIGFAPGRMNAQVGGHQPEITLPAFSWRDRMVRAGRVLRYLWRAPALRRSGDRAVVTARAEAAAWRQAPLPGNLENLRVELLRQLRRVREARTLFFLQTAGAASLSALIGQIEGRLPGEGPALAAALLAGGPASVTVEQGWALLDLAQQARQDPAARVLLAQPVHGLDWESLLPPANPFRLAFTDFLSRYGHRGVYETYFRTARWREDPAYLLETMRTLDTLEPVALRGRQRAAAAAAWQRVRAVFPFWQRILLRGLAKAASRECNQREAARSALIAYQEPIRRLLRAAGVWLFRQAALSAPLDIFNLTHLEIFRALSGKIPGPGLAARAADRRAQITAWSDEKPAAVFLEAPGTPLAAWTPPGKPAAPRHGHRLTGVAAGAGRIQGKARILHHPSEGGRLSAGDILVTASADPGWTFLFLKAGGIVIETGGYLSHAAVIAREFGIPTVINLPKIMDLLQEGEILDVDGNNGTVTRLGAQRED